MQETMLYAHRGGGHEVLENSYEAAAYTASLPGFVMETDVHASADGRVVVSHDGNVSRVWGVNLAIADTAWDTLRTLRGRGGERMARLDDILRDFPQLRLNIEPKDNRVVKPLIAVIDRYNAWDKVRISSFSTRRIRAIRRARPYALTGATPAEIVRLFCAGQLGYRPFRHGRYFSAVQVPERYGIVRVVSARFVACCHRVGVPVHVWTVNDPQVMERLLDLHVDAIMTDAPQVLRHVIAYRSA